MDNNTDVNGGPNKPHDGKIGTMYVCWGLDGAQAPTQQIVLMRSQDGGHTWGGEVPGDNLPIQLSQKTAISGIGFAMLYSAANGNLQPWASRQMTRFAIALMPMIVVGLIDVRFWFRSAYWIYGASLLLVIAVDLRGVAGLGAQRWIDLGFLQLQPSEVMKINRS